eukprot:3050589-Prymnesium_polylepis.1
MTAFPKRGPHIGILSRWFLDFPSDGTFCGARARSPAVSHHMIAFMTLRTEYSKSHETQRVGTGIPWALAKREALRTAYPYQPELCHAQQTNRSP